MYATRRIVGERYTQVTQRDRQADLAAALTQGTDYDALMYLHALGYDVSQARVSH